MRYTATQAGFSLVETLVSITILLIVIIGPMTISTSAAKSTSFATEQVTAFFLAQEGVELVEKARNDLMLQHFSNATLYPDPWADFTRSVAPGVYRQCYGSSGCSFSITNSPIGALSSISGCGGQDSCKIRLDPDNTSLRAKFNTGSTGAITMYQRIIKLELLPSGKEVSVTSTVTWRSGFSRDPQQVVVQSSLFNIYDTP